MRAFTLLMILLNFSWMVCGVSRISLMRRSTLLMKRSGFTRSRRACMRTVSVCVMGPSTASTTTSAPSTALSDLVTAPEKSMCPGVSMRLMRCSTPL